jgi:succinate dehydrogenase hydrophobic anchor subunit
MRARWHLLHLFTGLVIAVLLGIHMVVLHLDAVLGFFSVATAEPTSWAAMIGRARQGIWVGIYIALLAVVLYHALYGLRGIILEVTTSAKAGRIINWSFIIIGLITFIWGAYVPVALLSS